MAYFRHPTDAMTKFLTATAAALLLLLTACTTRDTTDPWNNPPVPADSLINLSYDSDTSNKLDLYLPTARSQDSTPLLVLVHGGTADYWASGDKRDMQVWVNRLRAQLPKWAIANINYRLNTAPPTNAFPAQETDVQVAINFLYQNRVNWHISDRIVLAGWSTGGQLALLHSYKRANPVAIKAVAALSAPSDLDDFYQYQAVPTQWRMQQLMSGSPASNSVLYQQSSPQTFVGLHTIPTFLAQGMLDSVMPYAQTDALAARLQANNVPHSYLFYPAEKHVYADTTLNHTLDSLATWLKERVR
ncbi:MAG: alpha/beta hydrolase [Chitinophagaceae bacterium]|nr:MAG: alpha/beta hydrolase [Chitinophagaceae bacterium]